MGLKTIITTTVLSAIFLSGCAMTKNKTEVVEKNPDRAIAAEPSANQQAAITLDRNIVSEIEFDPGRKALSPEATAELNRAILEAKERGEVGSVNVAVWSDMAYPTEDAKGLPRTQVELAKERGENIEKYMDRMQPEADIKVHNMARRPTAFSNFLNTQDAELKNRLAAMGIAESATAQSAQERKSTALVFIKLK